MSHLPVMRKVTYVNEWRNRPVEIDELFVAEGWLDAIAGGRDDMGQPRHVPVVVVAETRMSSFKVSWGDADEPPSRIAGRGHQVVNEKAARRYFPMLDDKVFLS